MAVEYHNEDTDYRLPQKGRTSEWIRRCVAGEGFRLGPVNFIFCSPERHIGINRQYLGHDYYTDVITFDYSDLNGGGIVSGDIFIDPVTVAANAPEYGAEPLEEMRRVLIHGVLHLCGYGDKTPAQQAVMRSKEDHYLRQFEKIGLKDGKERP